MDFINDLLKLLGRDSISELKDFDNVTRKELEHEDIDTLIDSHIDNLVKKYGKARLSLKNRSRNKVYVLTVLKVIGEDMGYCLTSKIKTIYLNKKQNKIVNYYFEVI